MTSGGNFSLNDVVVEVIDDIPSHIAVSVEGIKVPEEHCAGTNLEPDHVGQEARQIEAVDVLQWIDVLLIHTVAPLVELLNTREFLHYVAVHHF